jgi:hypothetical protein
MRRAIPGAVTILMLLLAPAAHAAAEVDALALDVERLESLREVKDLQRIYVHYTQYGRWNDAADLFTAQARFIRGKDVVTGRQSISVWLKARGDSNQGLATGALNTEFIDEPLVNLSPDGRSAKGRWMSLSLRADGKG